MAIFSKVFAIMSVSALFTHVYGNDGTGTVGETEGFDHSDDDDDTDYCLDKLECAGDSIDADYIFCDGYYGCYESSLEVTKAAYLDGFRGGQEAEAYSSNDIYCGGYIGCFMSETTSMNNTICDGHTSCYNSMIYSYGDIYLYGYKAATASDVFGNSTDVSLYAFGAYSALYSVINDVETIYNYGLYGLYFADIFTDDIENGKFTMYNYGRLSTYYAQLYCSHATICNIYCRDYGCYGFEVWAAKGAKINVYYEDEDCDSELTIVYAKGAKSGDDNVEDHELEFKKQFEARKEMKTQAKLEFKKKYGHESNSFKTEKEFNDFDVAGKFEEIAEEVQLRMGMIDGKLESLNVYKTNVINENTIDTFEMDSDNVINISNQNKGKFDFESAGYGMIVGIILLFIGKYVIHVISFVNQSSNGKLIGQNSGYAYQSISQ